MKWIWTDDNDVPSWCWWLQVGDDLLMFSTEFQGWWNHNNIFWMFVSDANASRYIIRHQHRSVVINKSPLSIKKDDSKTKSLWMWTVCNSGRYWIQKMDGLKQKNPTCIFQRRLRKITWLFSILKGAILIRIQFSNLLSRIAYTVGLLSRDSTTRKDWKWSVSFGSF